VQWRAGGINRDDRAERELHETICAASRAGAAVRAIAPLAGMGKTRVAEVARGAFPRES